MRANLEATKGQVMAESVMIALAGKGMGRQEAHRLVREAAVTARKKDVHVKEVLAADPAVAKLRLRRNCKTRWILIDMWAGAGRSWTRFSSADLGRDNAAPGLLSINLWGSVQGFARPPHRPSGPPASAW